jgi:hypothetical protein
MMIIKHKGELKLIACHDAGIYKNRSTKIVGHLEGDYPSLKTLRIGKRSVKDAIDFLDEKIKDHNRQKENYKIQLKKFKDDLSFLGVDL